jgi:GrpB-like predicted nucleotidyltransferase (UPF0157 family)
MPMYVIVATPAQWSRTAGEWHVGSGAILTAMPDHTIIDCLVIQAQTHSRPTGLTPLPGDGVIPGEHEHVTRTRIIDRRRA